MLDNLVRDAGTTTPILCTRNPSLSKRGVRPLGLSPSRDSTVRQNSRTDAQGKRRASLIEWPAGPQEAAYGVRVTVSGNPAAVPSAFDY